MLKQLKSPYSILKSIKWLKNYTFGGNFSNPIGARDISYEKTIRSEVPELCLGFVGDLMGTNNKKLTFSDKIKTWFSDCDYVFGNLEGPLLKKSDLVFIKQHNSAERLLELAELKALDKWVFGLSNNHTFDYGNEGVEKTIEEIQKNGAQWFGLASKPAIKIKEVEIWGAASFSNVPNIQVAFLEDIKATHPKNNHYQILYVHWGEEFFHFPTEEQKNLRESELKQFDFLVGHHSHTPQPIVYEKNQGTAYSLGNLYIYFNKQMMRKGKILKLYFAGNKLARISWAWSVVENITPKEISVGLLKN